MTQLATADSFTAAPRNGSTGGAMAQVESNRAVAEVQAAMAIAKRFPRDEIAAMDRIRNACARPRLAEAALYSYARGGTDISGPSIRLAEAVAQQWWNMQFGIQELDQENGESTVEAFAWDMETNTRVSKVFRVPHLRHTKSGSYKLTDPRDIYETVANNGARRLRACILGVIPGDVIEDAVAACEATLNTKCDVGPEAQKKLISAFREMGVSREQIEKRIQCRIDAIKPAQMVQMRKIYTSMRDGMSAAADWFEQPSNNGSGNGTGSGSGSGAVSGAVNAEALTGGHGTTEKRPHQPATSDQNNSQPTSQTSDGGPTSEDTAGTVDHSPGNLDDLQPLLDACKTLKDVNSVQAACAKRSLDDSLHNWLAEACHVRREQIREASKK